MKLGKVIVNALAFVVAGLIVPQFTLKFGSSTEGLLLILGVAAVFGVINTFLKPIVKLLSFPVNLVTMGLFGFVVNAALLIGFAWLVGLFVTKPYVFQLGGFPPHFSADTLVAAVLGSIVISIVSTIMSLLVPDSR